MKGKQLHQAAVPARLKPMILSVILAATPSLAAAQFKCVDKAGNIVLTDLACPGRNTRGPQKVEKSTPAGATENAQQTSGAGNSATMNRGNVPARQQPLDAANEKPRSGKAS